MYVFLTFVTELEKAFNLQTTATAGILFKKNDGHFLPLKIKFGFAMDIWGRKRTQKTHQMQHLRYCFLILLSAKEIFIGTLRKHDF